jgi:hypothetical protein
MDYRLQFQEDIFYNGIVDITRILILLKSTDSIETAITHNFVDRINDINLKAINNDGILSTEIALTLTFGIPSEIVPLIENYIAGVFSEYPTLSYKVVINDIYFNIKITGPRNDLITFFATAEYPPFLT